jgi:hypothetical protein
LELFGLGKIVTGVDPFRNIKGYEVPQYLTDNIRRIKEVTAWKPYSIVTNEAFSRAMIDQVWIAALYEEGQAIRKEEHQEQPSTLHAHSSTQPSTSTYTTEDPARLELMHEMQLQRPVCLPRRREQNTMWILRLQSLVRKQQESKLPRHQSAHDRSQKKL